jgi:hypothetical protein
MLFALQAPYLKQQQQQQMIDENLRVNFISAFMQ